MDYLGTRVLLRVRGRKIGLLPVGEVHAEAEMKSMPARAQERRAAAQTLGEARKHSPPEPPEAVWPW